MALYFISTSLDDRAQKQVLNPTSTKVIANAWDTNEFFVGVVDAQLLKRIVLKALETKDVEHLERSKGQVFLTQADAGATAFTYDWTC
eukprot:6203102-Pleurochrysis_carterae.AAC.1